MTIPEILSKLDRVRRSGRGWTARCPSHNPDKTPSLSIREGDRGILVRCWAGCSLDEICSALGIQKRDLFYDERPDPVRIHEAQRRRERKAAVQVAALRRPDVFREADQVLEEAKKINIASLTPGELDKVLDFVSDAHLILLRERDDEWTRTVAA